MSEFEVTVCVKQKCKCGQEWEQVIYLKKDRLADLVIYSVPPLMPTDFSKFEIPKMPDVQLSLVGYVERVVVNGMDMDGGRILCLTCREDLMYMGRGDIEGIGNVYPKGSP